MVCKYIMSSISELQKRLSSVADMANREGLATIREKLASLLLIPIDLKYCLCGSRPYQYLY